MKTACLFSAVLLCGAALGCPYSIRDAGFIVRDPEPFRLVVFHDPVMSITRGAMELEAKAAQEKHLKLSDVVMEVLATGTAGDEADRAAQLREDLTQKGARPPRAVLISPEGRGMVAHGSEAPLDRAWYENLARLAVTSPARQQIADLLVPSWCVLLVVQGKDAVENAAVLEAVQQAAQSMVGFKPEMGDTVTKAPPVVSVKWDDPQEQVLIWSLGLADHGESAAKAAIIFGRGRRLGPVFWGATITAETLKQGMRLLGRNCTCTSEPAQILGPVMPLRWDRDRQAQAREALGFDPDAPAALSALSGVWVDFRQGGEKRTPGEYLPDPASGYIELPLDMGEGAGEPGQEGEEERGETRPEAENVGMRAAIAATVGLAVLVAGGSAVLIMRRHGSV